MSDENNSSPGWITDAENDLLPENLDRFNLGPSEFLSGQRVGWWYMDDEEFNADAGLPHPREDPPFKGTVIPRPDVEMRGRKIAPEEAVLVIDCYPVEKEYCEVTYIAYRRLLNADDFRGCVILKTQGQP